MNQKSACFDLSTKINSGSTVEVKNSNDDLIVSFEAKEDFKTLIVSNEKVNGEKLYLYVNGKAIN